MSAAPILPVVDIPKTLGALLVGGLVAAIFSGVAVVQVFVYFKHYPADSVWLKSLVFTVWFLDLGHTLFVCFSLWEYLIDHYGNPARVDFISWSLPITIAITAALTFLVHCFFVHRIYKLSKNQHYIAVLLGSIACLRLCFACFTTTKMISLKSLGIFAEKYAWSFTSGLALSSLLDVLITISLCCFLMVGRQKNSSMNHVLDALILYAFENGALTCVATIISMICWLAMPTNLIFMGLHFVISKFYANSFLATLHTRTRTQNDRGSASCSRDRSTPVVFPDSFGFSRRSSRRIDPPKAIPLQITVEESMTRITDSPTHGFNSDTC